MKGALALAAVLGLVAWDAWRGDLPDVIAPVESRNSPDSSAGSGGPGQAGSRPERDPFRFGGEPPALTTAAQPAAAPRDAPPPARAEPGPTEPVRLVGFIRQGQELRAALSVLGRVALVAEGESVEGYELVAVEEDVAVRVRSPEGEDRELRLPAR